MMSSVKVLNDDGARHDAISRHDRSILVEAGAGSGKTAVMAGRIAVMLAQGVAPSSIAAVTFTELAASELLLRVRDFVEDLAAGHIAPELRAGLPEGLSAAQRENLMSASTAIDEITCSTIHGFCQRALHEHAFESGAPFDAELVQSTRRKRISIRAQRSSTATRPISTSSKSSKAGCASDCLAIRAASSPRWCCITRERPSL